MCCPSAGGVKSLDSAASSSTSQPVAAVTGDAGIAVVDVTPAAGGAAASNLASSHLPWGALKEKVAFPAAIHIDSQLQPGEFVMRTMFAEFALQVRKLDGCLSLCRYELKYRCILSINLFLLQSATR